MDKNIFAYFDGEKQVLGDPVAIYRRLQMRLGGDLNGAYQQSKAVIPGSEDLDGQGKPIKNTAKPDWLTAGPMQERLWHAVRECFPMAKWNPTIGDEIHPGASEDDCVLALHDFLDFLDGKKKPIAIQPTSQEPSGFPGFSLGATMPTMEPSRTALRSASS